MKQLKMEYVKEKASEKRKKKWSILWGERQTKWMTEVIFLLMKKNK